MERTDVKVGQDVYLVPLELSDKSQCIKGMLEMTNNKHYTVLVGEYQTFKFDTDTLLDDSEFLPQYRLYFTEQEMLETEERKLLSAKVSEYFESSNNINALTLDKLRRISAIIEEPTASDFYKE